MTRDSRLPSRVLAKQAEEAFKALLQRALSLPTSPNSATDDRLLAREELQRRSHSELSPDLVRQVAFGMGRRPGTIQPWLRLGRVTALRAIGAALGHSWEPAGAKSAIAAALIAKGARYLIWELDRTKLASLCQVASLGGDPTTLICDCAERFFELAAKIESPKKSNAARAPIARRRRAPAATGKVHACATVASPHESAPLALDLATPPTGQHAASWSQPIPELISSRAPPAVRGIPSLPAPFTHRPRLEKALRNALRDRSGVVLACLWGTGGLGKTTLACQFCDRMTRRQRSPTIAWVDVRERGGSTTAVAEALLARLGHAGNVYDAREGLVRLRDIFGGPPLRGSNVLVVLDNADYPNASFAKFVSRLAGLRHCRVIVTARQPQFAAKIRSFGQATIQVDHFQPDEAIACLKACLEDDRVRSRDAAGLRAVAAAVAFVPLWVEMAGAYLRVMRLPLLEFAAGSGPFEMVWDELSDEERNLFAACGACASTGFALQAAARTAGTTEPAALAGLHNLEKWHLVRSIDDGRFILHEELRQRARRTGPPFTAAVQRHAEWVLAALPRPTEPVHVVEPISEELTAAVEDADGRMLLALCERAWWFWLAVGPWTFAVKHLERARHVAAQLGDDAAVSESLRALASILNRVGDWASVFSLAAEKARLDTRRSDWLGVSQALLRAGCTRMCKYDLDQARPELEEALRLARENGAGPYQLGRSLRKMGELERRCNRLDAALRYFEDSLALVQKFGYRDQLAGLWREIAMVHLLASRFDQAADFLEMALAAHQQLHNRYGVAKSLLIKGWLHLNQGDCEAAGPCLAKSHEICARLGASLMVAKNHYALAYLSEHTSAWRDSASLYRRALVGFRRLGRMPGVADCEAGLARIRARQSRRRQGPRLVRQEG